MLRDKEFHPFGRSNHDFHMSSRGCYLHGGDRLKIQPPAGLVGK